ncbi:glycine/betaine ABC transporter substrate-binding protein [Leptolyngbya valderiana BDU 20041]|nr:glycine/betaine ABC transporter substrate-binding protein [Leptolyngbya valderiana BDU 20041]
MLQYGSEIWLRTGEHLLLVALSVAIALCIGIPAGLLVTRRPQLAPPVIGFANAVQTIPSLAIFGFLISVPLLGGIGKIPAIVALFLYALLPLVRNTYAGITGVDPAIVEAGRGMGMTDRQVLWKVEFPLAMGVIIAGVRVATVTSVGVATIASAIGAGGLGVFIFRGIATVNNSLILAGAVPAAIMALLADFAIGQVEKVLRQGGGWRKSSTPRSVALLVLVGLLGAIALYSPSDSTSPASGDIAIGSKNFTEQVVLGELLAQQIENNTNLTVARQFNLGGTFICHEAVKSGQIDGYVEYTGTAFAGILNRDPIADAETVEREVRKAYKEQFDLVVMPSLGFENTFAIVVRGEDARRYKLQQLSDLKRQADEWRPGFGYEFIERDDGYPGLARTYDLDFARSPDIMELGLMYRALVHHQVDVVAANSTDGLLGKLDLVVLEDDKQYFPPYEAVPVFSRETLERYPEVREAIAQLAGQISESDIQAMNYAVDGEFRPLAEVVREFLSSRSSEVVSSETASSASRFSELSKLAKKQL